MDFETLWHGLRDRCEELDSETVLVTPISQRVFDIVTALEDRIVIQYRTDERERVLWRDQFEMLHDRLEAKPEGLSLSDLPAGIEPYVTVVSLSPEYTVDGSPNRLRRADGDGGTESPFLRTAWRERTRPERVRDDALLLTDLIDRYDVEHPASLSPDQLVDLYVLLSDVQHGADALRKSIGDRLGEYIGPGATLQGPFGAVRRTSRTRRRLKDEETVLDALDREGIPHEWVLGVDREKLDVVLAVTDLEEGDVYDTDEQVYVQKTAVEEETKQSRLQGLRDRLARLDTEEATQLRQDIQELEERLDSVLAAG